MSELWCDEDLSDISEIDSNPTEDVLPELDQLDEPFPQFVNESILYYFGEELRDEELEPPLKKSKSV